MSTEPSWQEGEKLAMPTNLKLIRNFRMTDHALFEMARRQLNQKLVATVLASPEQTELILPGRAVYQSRYTDEAWSKTFLLRVFVDINRNPPEVVTVYRTSKIEKYWRK